MYTLCKTTHFKVKKTHSHLVTVAASHRSSSLCHPPENKENEHSEENSRLCLQRWTKTDCCLNQESIFSPFSLTASWSLNELLTKKTPARKKTWPTIFVEVPSRIVMIMYFCWCLSREDTVWTLEDHKVIT